MSKNDLKIYFNYARIYLFITRTRVYKNKRKYIYKLGKTKQENLKRILNYPNGTKLIIQLECENEDI